MILFGRAKAHIVGSRATIAGSAFPGKLSDFRFRRQKALETARFRIGDIASSSGRTQKNIANLKRKIAESERCIAAHERRTKRPVATDLQSFADVGWGSRRTTVVAMVDQRRPIWAMTRTLTLLTAPP
jgi:hypothetical protein